MLKKGKLPVLVAEDHSTYTLVVEDISENWRLYEFNDPGYSTNKMYRAYHRHDDGWVSQLMLMAVCTRCGAKAPEAMEGFKKLISWEV